MKSYLINLIILGVALATNATVVSAADNSWMSPEARAFFELDTTGNGLLLRNEASQHNAFNNKQFTEADVNQDGTIDLDEYIHYKTGKWPTIEDRINTDAQTVS